MSDPDIHLKLDRILTGQAQAQAGIVKHGERIDALISALTMLKDAIDTNTETLSRLAAAMSEEPNGDLGKELASIAASLKQIEADGARMVEMLDRMPDAVANATHDAFVMAVGDGVGVPPNGKRQPE